MAQERIPIVQMAGITKTYAGGILANNQASLAAFEGEVHAVVGENGAGKSTLMNVLYGTVMPDAGRIRLRGEDVRIETPARAIALGVGMVTQHTTLIPALTALENVLLGAEPTRGGLLDLARGRAAVEGVAARLGVSVDWGARAGSLSVAALQKAEIVKALYRGARILILDEPTAALAPQEADALFALLAALRSGGATILLVTHKLGEVMAHSQRVTVLRGGQTAAEMATGETSPEDLLRLMLGARTATPGVDLRGADAEPAPAAVRATGVPAVPTLEVRGLVVMGSRGAAAVRGVSLEVRPGEVLGIAGVDGSGQRELVEALVGLRRAAAGRVALDGTDVTRASVASRLRRGVAYVPENRHVQGLVLDFTVAENLVLGRHRDPGVGGGRITSPAGFERTARAATGAFRVSAPGIHAPARTLSGGNQQKLVLARALWGSPRLLVAAQPTRGLDVEATRFVYERLREALGRGLAVLLVSLDLDEVLALSDRVAVMYNGAVAGVLARQEADPDRIGRLMLTGSDTPEGPP